MMTGVVIDNDSSDKKEEKEEKKKNDKAEKDKSRPWRKKIRRKRNNSDTRINQAAEAIPEAEEAARGSDTEAESSRRR